MRRFLRVSLLLIHNQRIHVSKYVRVTRLASVYCWCIWSIVTPASASRACSSSVVAPSGGLKPRSRSWARRNSGADENPLCIPSNPPRILSARASSPCISKMCSALRSGAVVWPDVDEVAAVVPLWVMARLTPTTTPIITARIAKFRMEGK